ncbi:hypothetical protein GCM10009127_04070 [Alteraurantiacibacter aestuarii]|uniref:DoxX family membrane protein n=1 Tax=Alteraurantiacibacter aestuarii TaxID=650004 RepID=A0A844ZLZ9_9SPHN|nr:DoxX family membrane protein [Alteraurantiacibacter aestuarii]MXO88342.1 hypothetical protein [Alteraurantiacibacter aestuarii]
MNRLLLPARLVFGLIMLANGLSHFFGQFLPMPTGTMPLAVQLMEALQFSELINVAMGIQLVAGALVLAGLFMPLALAAVMPVNVCALYWALVLERDPLWALVAVIVVGLNALLMLAHMDHYRPMLERRPLAAGEGAENGEYYESLYANPAGQTAPRKFALALLPLLGAAAFFQLIVPAVFAFFCLVVLLWPATVLLLRTAQSVVARG